MVRARNDHVDRLVGGASRFGLAGRWKKKTRQRFGASSFGSISQFIFCLFVCLFCVFFSLAAKALSPGLDAVGRVSSSSDSHSPLVIRGIVFVLFLLFLFMKNSVTKPHFGHGSDD